MVKRVLKFLGRDLLLLWVLAAAPRLACAQAPAFDWAESLGGTGLMSNTTAVDAAGNLYVAGWFYTSMTIGSFQLTVPTTGVYVAKRSAGGSWQWASVIPGAESVGGLAVDAAGNVYLTGTFREVSIQVGNAVLTNQSPSGGIYDVYVAKIAPNGVWQWGASGGSWNGETAGGIAVSGAGNVYITGYLGSWNVNFGGITVPAGSSDGVMIAKLSPTGAWQWIRTVTSPDIEAGIDIGVDGAENLYVTGQFAGATLAFGNHTVTNQGISTPTDPSVDIFVAKMNAAGNWDWARAAGGSDDEEVQALAVDRRGNVYVTGAFVGPATFGNQQIYHLGASDLFVAKLDAGGNWQWATTGSGQGRDSGMALALDQRGGVYVAGTAATLAFPDVLFGNGQVSLTCTGYQDAFVAKLDSSGAWHWVLGGNGARDEKAEGVAVDAAGRVYLAGLSLSSTLTFGTTTFTQPVASRYLGFVARVNPQLTGTAEEAAGGGVPVLAVWPNPARGQAMVKLPAGTAVVSLLDPLGRVVRTSQRQADQEVLALDLTGLCPGLYVVKIGQRVARLVVE